MPLEKVNSKCVKGSADPGQAILARTGAMLFYTGEVAFSPHTPGGAQGMPSMGGLMGLAGKMMAGEHAPMMAAQGSGEVHYGFLGHEVTVVQLDHGMSMQVESSRLLAHDSSLQSSIVALVQSGGVRGAVRGAMTGQGLFTTQLSGAGSVAMLSHGGTFDLPVDQGRQVVVDPQAYVGHTGQLRLDVSADVGWRNAVGRGSGEAIQLVASGQGVLYVQASEQKF